MPLMGVPDNVRTNQNLAGVTMTRDANSSSENGKPQNKQELLNKLANIQDDGRSIFKDGKKHNQIGKDEFMKLLSHQMQHQDPMNPMEQTKFVGELAQFAQLEQMTSLNSKFDSMNQNVTAENKFYAASFLGKNVMTSGTTLSVKGDGSPTDVFFKLDKDAAKVMVRFFDKKNNMVGEMSKENLSRGSQNLQWDGKQLDGAPTTKGDYTVQIFAYDAQNNQIPVESKVSGTVTGVNFENGETVFTVDGDKKIFLRDVDNFSLDGKTQEKKMFPQAQMQAMNAYGKQGAPSANVISAPQRQMKVEMPSAEEMAEIANEEVASGLDYGDE